MKPIIHKGLGDNLLPSTGETGSDTPNNVLINRRPSLPLHIFKRFQVQFKRNVAPLFSTTSNIPISKSFTLISIRICPGGGGYDVN
jgi:hypothetical protein